MRICSYRRDDGTARAGIVDGDRVLDAGLTPWDPSPGPLVGSVDGVALVAPIPVPGKVVCVGRNYAEHAAETGSAVPTQPQLFSKWANAVVGPGSVVALPAITHALDYEAELVVVIGRAARRVSEEHALDHVLGYTCGDDISARDLQFGDTQWTRGKALDTFAPMGPWIVTADEIPDPQNLGIRCFRQWRAAARRHDRAHALPGRAADRLHHGGDHVGARRRHLLRHPSRRRPRAPTARLPATR